MDPPLPEGEGRKAGARGFVTRVHPPACAWHHGIPSVRVRSSDGNRSPAGGFIAPRPAEGNPNGYGGRHPSCTRPPAWPSAPMASAARAAPGHAGRGAARTGRSRVAALGRVTDPWLGGGPCSAKRRFLPVFRRLSGALLVIMTRLNFDFVPRQRENPRENQAITTTRGLAAGSFDSRRGKEIPVWAQPGGLRAILWQGTAKDISLGRNQFPSGRMQRGLEEATPDVITTVSHGIDFFVRQQDSAQEKRCEPLSCKRQFVLLATQEQYRNLAGGTQRLQRTNAVLLPLNLNGVLQLEPQRPVRHDLQHDPGFGGWCVFHIRAVPPPDVSHP